MKYAVKGILFSGLVFPGLGQLMLKRYQRGIAIVLVVLICFIVLTVKATRQALAILEQLESTGGNIDMNAISSAAATASAYSDNLTMNACLILILICWCMGTIDAYMIGRRMDRQGKTTPD